MAGVGNGLTATAKLSEAEHPAAFVTVTVYVPLVVVLIVCVLAPVFQA
jgi:hypothetical protein